MSKVFGLKQKEFNTIILVVVIIVAFSAVMGARRRQDVGLGEPKGTFWEELFGITERNVMGVALEVHYVDGGVTMVDPMEGISLTLIPEPLTVTDDVGREIDHVRWYAKIKVSWEGTSTDDNTNVQMAYYFNDKVASDLTHTFSRENILVNGEYADLGNGYIAAALEHYGEEGENELRIRCQCITYVGFASGYDEMEGDGSAYMTYNKDTGDDDGEGYITAVSILVIPTVVT